MRSAPSAVRLPGRMAQRPPADSRSRHRAAGWLAVAALATVACGLATAYGFWTSSGHRLLKFEAALGIATVGSAIVPLTVLARSERRAAEQRGELRFLLAFAAALLSSAAALVHLAVIDQHFADYWLYGLFFAIVGPAQLAWSIMVLSRPSRVLYWAGALGNALIVAFFVVTRTVGPLIGPEAGHPQTLGFGDTATTVFEAFVVALCVVLITGTRRAWRSRPVQLPAATSLITLLLMPQIALALQSAIASAPFVPHSG